MFLVSPNDVPKERNYLDEVIDEINLTIAGSKGVELDVVRSEKKLSLSKIFPLLRIYE
jgi:hypothetical protein